VSRILIHEPRHPGNECAQMLAGEGHDVVVCPNRDALFDALAVRRPDLIVYVMDDLAMDLGALSVVRRAAATLPIILLGGPAGLEARRSVQELKPTYYGVFPLEPAELRDAVRGTLSRQNGRTHAS
jgi:DNA-binding response OmpR family regulator